MDWIGTEKLNDTHIGFIYKITNVKTNQFYIGKKNLQMYKTVKSFYKNGNTRKTKVYSESNWKSYYSSNVILKKIAKTNPEILKREILFGCASKKQLSYYETKIQFKLDCLEHPYSLNENICGKFFRKDVDPSNIY